MNPRRVRPAAASATLPAWSALVASGVLAHAPAGASPHHRTAGSPVRPRVTPATPVHPDAGVPLPPLTPLTPLPPPTPPAPPPAPPPPTPPTPPPPHPTPRPSPPDIVDGGLKAVRAAPLTETPVA